MKSADIFRCPSNPLNSQATEGANVLPGAPEIKKSYACNGRVLTDGTPLTQAGIDVPAGKILVCEYYNSEDTWSDYGSPWWTNNGNWIKGVAGTGSHSGMFNYLFVDGHVKALRPTQTIANSATAANQFNMWGGMDNGENGNTRSPNIERFESTIYNGVSAFEAKFK